MESTISPSPAGLAVISLLTIGPLHPYGMQRLIRAWGKDQVINVGRRANLYKTIKRLHEAGLITVRRTERDQQYPERTVYELTEQGRRAVPEWLAAMLSQSRREFPEFPAALSFVMLLEPDRTRNVLEERLAGLGVELGQLDADLERYTGVLPRITLLETEYLRAMTAAEMDWLTGVIDDLRTGVLTWTEEMAEMARTYLDE